MFRGKLLVCGDAIYRIFTSFPFHAEAWQGWVSLNVVATKKILAQFSK